MVLYLVRHAIAVENGTPGYSDEDRPLTEEGIDRMQRAARGLARLIDPPDLIASSPLLRAKQTAEILAVALQSRDGVTEWADLIPTAAANKALPQIKSQGTDASAVMLVGHEPHLSLLTALLMGTAPHAFAFKKGGVCALECPAKITQGSAKMLWFLTPKQLRQLA